MTVYARVVSNQSKPGKMDEWFSLIRDSLVPSLKEQKAASRGSSR